MNKKSEKIQQEFIIKSFSDENTLSEYSKDTFNIGLWETEKAMFTKYFAKDARILDIGCGAGRTTLGLYRLGFKNIVGVDITPGMIKEAKSNAKKVGIEIHFEVGDACSLAYEDNSFNGCLFSFNGIMQIPTRANRVIALKEIKRVMKKGGIFIFTTHDRELAEEWKWFWDEETARWEKGEQDQRIFEFGDRIVEEHGRLIFIHFPDREEVLQCIEESGMELMDEAWVSELVEETDAVKKRISKCKFWVVKKI